MVRYMCACVVCVPHLVLLPIGISYIVNKLIGLNDWMNIWGPPGVEPGLERERICMDALVLSIACLLCLLLDYLPSVTSVTFTALSGCQEMNQ